MKFQWRHAWKMLGLYGFQALREKESYTFENGAATENKEFVGRVRLVAGFVQVKEVHKVFRNNGKTTGRAIRGATSSKEEGTLPVVL